MLAKFKLSSLFVNSYRKTTSSFFIFYFNKKQISLKNSKNYFDLTKTNQTNCITNFLKSQIRLLNKQQYNDSHKNSSSKNYFFFVISFIPTVLLAKDLKEDNVNDDENYNVEKLKLKRRKNFNFLADAVEEVLPSLVQIEIKPSQTHYFNMQSSSSGSGFIVSSDGLIVTNAHVIRDLNQDIIVKLNDQRNFKARVVRMDRLTDLAILKIDCNSLKPARFGDSNSVRTGEFVIALGSPLTLTSSVTSGIVSNPFRDGMELGLNNEVFYIQTDTMITHGNSGGPLVNLDGEVIGINSMKVTDGISFSIPSKYAIELLDASKNASSKRYKYIGTKIVTLTQPLYRMLKRQSNLDIKLPKNYVQGCLVIEVEPNSPAEKAGLQRGDIIISANNVLINNNVDLFKIIRKTLSVNLIILRNDQKIEFNVKIEEK